MVLELCGVRADSLDFSHLLPPEFGQVLCLLVLCSYSRGRRRHVGRWCRCVQRQGLPLRVQAGASPRVAASSLQWRSNVRAMLTGAPPFLSQLTPDVRVQCDKNCPCRSAGQASGLGAACRSVTLRHQPAEDNSPGDIQCVALMWVQRIQDPGSRCARKQNG